MRQQMDAKRVLVAAIQSSAKPDVALAFVLGMLLVIQEEFERVRLRSPSAPTGISLPMDATQIGHLDRADISPLLPAIRTFLITLGFSVSVSNGVATISW